MTRSLTEEIKKDFKQALIIMGVLSIPYWFIMQYWCWITILEKLLNR